MAEYSIGGESLRADLCRVLMGQSCVRRGVIAPVTLLERTAFEGLAWREPGVFESGYQDNIVSDLNLLNVSEKGSSPRQQAGPMQPIDKIE